MYDYEIIAQSDVTPQRLAQVLTAAGIVDNEIDEDGDLFVRHEGLGFFIFIVHDRCIKLSGTFTFKETATHLQKLEMCNRANDGYMFPRFSFEEHRLVVDYFINIEEGLLLQLLLSSIEHYVGATYSILSDVNTEDILT